MAVNELAKLTEIRDVLPILKRLMDKGAVEVTEELTEKFRPKTEAFVRLTEESRNEENLRRIFDELSRARKQLDLLMMYIDLSKILIPTHSREVTKKELLEKSGAAATILNALCEKGIFELYKKETGRLDNALLAVTTASQLNEFQAEALAEIEKQFVSKPVVLLHGVTSSGKTEIYIQLIQNSDV